MPHGDFDFENPRGKFYLAVRDQGTTERRKKFISRQARDKDAEFFDVAGAQATTQGIGLFGFAATATSSREIRRSAINFAQDLTIANTHSAFLARQARIAARASEGVDEVTGASPELVEAAKFAETALRSTPAFDADLVDPRGSVATSAATGGGSGLRIA